MLLLPVSFFFCFSIKKERQIGEMMKNTGDSSKQLSMLNEQLGQKNRLVDAAFRFA